MKTEPNKKELTFKRIEDYKGFNINAWRLEEPSNGNHLIEILKDSKIIRTFLYPSYKIYNLQAHFTDIVEGELADSMSGYEAASWDGITNAIIIAP